MIKTIDPNAAAKSDSGIFGLPFTAEEAKVVYIPVPWEVTTSYGGGTSTGPRVILEASKQVDLYDLEVQNPYEVGMAMIHESTKVKNWNLEGKVLAQKIIEVSGDIGGDENLKQALHRVNELGEKLNQWVYSETRTILAEGKLVALVGGDHAIPFGAFQAAGEVFGNFGILHFDAHSDTRNAYEGFTWSHASIMYNTLKQNAHVEKLVQVGIRDFCQEEMDFIKSQGNRAKVFFDEDVQKRKLEGETFSGIAKEIVKELPQQVWISFDIDGLDPRYCPHTGTPVPGGLDFQEALYIIKAVAKSGRKIIGFDLNEVAPHPEGDDEWDANVGARLLYKLSAWMLYSQGLVPLNKRD